MTNYFIVEPPIDDSEPFSDFTYDLIVAFHEELEGTTGGRPLSNAIVIASGQLRRRYGERAAWELLDLRAFFQETAEEAPELVPHFPRFKSTLVAFLGFLARRHIVSPEAAARAELVTAPGRYPNRAARRRAEAIARQSGEHPPEDDDWEVLIAPRTMESDAA